MSLERVVADKQLSAETVRRIVTEYGGAAPLYIHTNCYVDLDGERLEWVHKLTDFKGRLPVYTTGLYNTEGWENQLL